jgi:hypothetical protein
MSQEGEDEERWPHLPAVRAHAYTLWTPFDGSFVGGPATEVFPKAPRVRLALALPSLLMLYMGCTACKRERPCSVGC